LKSISDTLKIKQAIASVPL